MHRGSATAYINQAINSQDAFAERIVFPRDETRIFTTVEYNNYLSRLNILLSERKQRCDVLQLTRGNEALPALKTYLETDSALFFKTLELSVSQALDKSFFEILKHLSDKGLASVKFVNAAQHRSRVDDHYLKELLDWIRDHKIATDIELPGDQGEAQQKIDELVSIHKREKRIAAYQQKGKSDKAEEKEGKGNSKHAKRERQQINKQNVTVDIEIEVQVEVAIEASVEAAVEQQAEDKDNREFIDRDEFLRRAKAKEFKLDEPVYEGIEGYEKRTWDHWLGNINQWVVGPKKIAAVDIGEGRPKCGLLVRSSPPQFDDASIGENYDCAYVLIQSQPGKPVTAIYFVRKSLDFCWHTFINNKFESSRVDWHLEPSLYQHNVSAFLNHFYPGVASKTNNFPEIAELTPEQIKKAAALSLNVPINVQKPITLLFEDPKERWKGKIIFDASAELEDEKSIEALQDRCKNKFINPEIVPQLYLNPNLSILTTTACEKLLQHQAQLQYGLDFLHLPAGFEIVETMINGKLTRFLDYSAQKARIKKNDPFAIQFCKRPEASPLSHDIFNDWHQNGKHSFFEQSIKGHYQTILLQKGYNRHWVDQFKKYLPVMLQMTDNPVPVTGVNGALEALIKAAKKYQKKLREIPANLEKHLLFPLIKDKLELLRTVKEWQEKLKLTANDLNGFLTVYDAYGEKGLSDLFASWKIQNTDPDILTQLHQHYFVHCVTYQPFLDKQYAEAIDILKRFTKEEISWWNSLFEQHCAAVGYDDLFSLVKAFQAFVDKVGKKNLKLYALNPQYSHFKGVKNLPTALSRMLAIINNSSPADLGLVWEGITQLDLQSNGAIRIIDDGKKVLGSGQLLLPEMHLQPEFYFEEHDYGLFAKDVTDFRSHSHVTYKYGKYGGFLIKPNILRDRLLSVSSKIKEKPEHGYHGLQFTHGEHTSGAFIESSNSFHQLISHSKTQKELERNYYRYLGANENRLSLSFYRKAAEIINIELPDKPFINNFSIRAGFYGVIAAATSGLEACLLLNDEASALQEITTLCHIFRKITFPPLVPGSMIRGRLFNDHFIKQLNPMPPLPYLKKMMSMMQKGFTVGVGDILTPTESKKRWEEYGEFFHTVSVIAEKHKYAFHEGIQFIDEEKMGYEGIFKFADLAKKLNVLWEDQYSSASVSAQNSIDQIRSGLISLMSTFQMTAGVTDNDFGMKGPIFWPSSERFLGLLGSSLKLLSRMKTNISPATSKQLTEDDLKQFVTTLQVADPALDVNQLAVQLVKEKFAGHFDKDFFDSLHSASLSAEVENKIRQGFESIEEQNWVKSILLSFKGADDTFRRMGTVERLIRIVNRLPLGDRAPFLRTLTSLNANQDNTLEQLNNLLVEVSNRNNINHLIFLSDFSKNEPTTGLISKMIRYYQDVLPFILGDKPKIMSILDIQPLAARLLFNFNDDPAKFQGFLTGVLENIYELVTAYPNEKQGILDLVNSFISEIKRTPSDKIFPAAVSNFVRYLLASKDLHDADLIRSLSDHYRKKSLELRVLLVAIQDFDRDQQHFILSMISVLLNNGRTCTPEVIQQFIGVCKAKPELLMLARMFFLCPPYPTFEQMLDWHDANKTAPDYEKAMQASYQAYNLQPCPREPENGFKLDEARKYALKFKGMHFTEDELQALETSVNWAATQTASKLKEELKKLSTKELEKLPVAERQKKHSQLLAILAELLYRSKGSAGGKGKSYEINTVQYLAILSLLRSNGHITSEIATGEGKSRIMMLAIACQYALGKTVDFVTSDMQLAQRDYLEYQAFFKMLGAETRLISATSAPDVYRIKGINFSDASNLSLFRNKARSNGEGHKVIDPDLHKRALLLDEADRTFYDISETRFNYSQEANENIKNMEWIYPLLGRFFSQKDPKQSKLVRELYLKDIDGCNKALKDFIKAQPEYPLEITEEMFERFQALTLGQIESWQEAAVTALDLKLGKDYAIEPNVLIETTKGPKLASEARLIYGHRLSRNSKFSFGVHQCLAALLNIELKDPNSATSKKCAELNRESKATVTHPFFIHPEKQIVYSTTSKSFLDEYHQGHLWAVTGTGGAIIEREEAAALFGKDNDEFHAMEFVTVPRKEELQRLDRLLRLTGNFDQRVAAILEEIVEARKAGRPVLLICENDQEAEKIRDALKALVQKLPAAEQIPGAQWQYVDSATSSEEERAKIETAGEPGIVTISTSRLARGTDIKTKAAGGLRVLGSYLPRERDLWQMFGRGGRYGALGDARLIVDTEQLCRQLGKKKLDSHFFFANEFFVKNQQSRFDREKQVERLIRNALSDFRIKITDAFFKYFDKLKDNGVAEKERQEKLMLWSDFTKKVDQLWNQAWPDLAHLMSQPVIQMHQVKRRLAKFKAAAQAEWEGLRGALKADKELPLAVSDLALDPRTEHLVRRMMPKRKYTMADRTLVYQTYDKALDGRAAVYDELFADWKASWRGQRKWFANTRAWWQGHGILFADTRAWWAGNRLLFASLRAWWNKNNKVVAAPVISANLMEALGNYRDQELKPFVCELDATQFLNPQKGDLLLSFKIQLVEAVLDFAHDRIEKGKTVSRKDMKDMYDLLVVVRDTKVSKQTEFVTAVSDKLAHTTVRFFGRSLQKDLNKIIEQRSQEQQEDKQAVLEDVPGWRPVVAAAAA